MLLSENMEANNSDLLPHELKDCLHITTLSAHFTAACFANWLYYSKYCLLLLGWQLSFTTALSLINFRES